MGKPRLVEVITFRHNTANRRNADTRILVELTPKPAQRVVNLDGFFFNELDKQEVPQDLHGSPQGGPTTWTRDTSFLNDVSLPSPLGASVPFCKMKALDWMVPTSRCVFVPKAASP